jgi:Holliday junction DNA helicase RuvA
VVGYGRAEKHQVQQMMKLLLGLSALPSPHDAADALAGRPVSRAFHVVGPDGSGADGAAREGADELAPLPAATIVIGHLRGRIFEKHPNRIVVDVNGIGYDVSVPLSTFYGLGEPGSEIALRIHTHVREDALLLYGFATPLEQQLFERLISVSGIGPKVALAVLSGIEPSDLIRAIEREDIARMTSIPGVGKKTAERIVLELKDRLPRPPIGASAGGAATVEPPADQARCHLGADQPGVSSAPRRKGRGVGPQGNTGRRLRTDVETSAAGARAVARSEGPAAGLAQRSARPPGAGPASRWTIAS